jgi:hypothetical protein
VPSLCPEGTTRGGSSLLGCRGDNVTGTRVAPQGRGRRAHGHMALRCALGSEGPEAGAWPAPLAPATRWQRTLASGSSGSSAADAAPVGTRAVLERRGVAGSPVNTRLTTFHFKSLNCAKKYPKTKVVEEMSLYNFYKGR